MDRRLILALAVLAALMFGLLAAVASANLPAAPAGHLADTVSNRISAFVCRPLNASVANLGCRSRESRLRPLNE
jgi:hypothetical protein